MVPTSKSLMSATLLLLIVEIKITKLRAASYGTCSCQMSLKSFTWLRKQATRHHYTSFMFEIRFVLHELVFKIPTEGHRLHHIHSLIHRKKANIHVVFVMEEVVLGEIFLRTLQFSYLYHPIIDP
jgi:hypothetical protein